MLEWSLVSIVAETGRLDSESSSSSVCAGSLDGGCWEELGGAEGMAVLGTEEMTDESSAGSGWASGDEHFGVGMLYWSGKSSSSSGSMKAGAGGGMAVPLAARG